MKSNIFCAVTLAASTLLLCPAAAQTQFYAVGAVVDWTVPIGAFYDIAAFGASGGAGHAGSVGGTGAEAAGEFYLYAGDVLEIAVGGKGGDGVEYRPGRWGSGGGGGGTFVSLTSPNGIYPILVAGGGGGAGGVIDTRPFVSAPYANGGAGQFGQDGAAGAGNDFSGGAGGVGGTGGVGGGGSIVLQPDNIVRSPSDIVPVGGGGGGAGYDWRGLNGGPPHFGQGGSTPAQGYAGGFPDGGGISGGGGFGGGGGGAIFGGGGGGGFSGGGGGGWGEVGYPNFFGLAGGGGGSFDSSPIPLPVAQYNIGDGLVTIDMVPQDPPPGAVPEPDGWVLMIAGLGAVGGMTRRARRAGHPSAA